LFHGVKIQNYIHLIKLQPSFRTDPKKWQYCQKIRDDLPRVDRKILTLYGKNGNIAKKNV